MPGRKRKAKNPADVVLRARLRETVHFPDLTERLGLRLSSISTYTAPLHFGIWHRKVGVPEYNKPDALYTPLVHVELEATDVRVDPRQPFHVQGETFLAKSLDDDGRVRHLVREGRHTVMRPDGTVVATARLMNVFTRYDPDPARRRVTELPPDLNLGTSPSRTTTLPDIDALVPGDRAADFTEQETHVWHYGQTDANRHVNGMEYLRAMECYVADVLNGAGHDLRRLWFTRARIVYRKPCFRGESYRRRAWFVGEAPLALAGAFFKASEGVDARPAAAVELTLAQHD